MNIAERIDFAMLCEPVARSLWGDPSQSSDKELRWGAHGARALDRRSGLWFDHEAAEGGSSIELIRRERGLDFQGAVAWLRREGFLADGVAKPNGHAAPNGTTKPGAKPVTVYDYVDRDGQCRFQVVRFEPKNFRQRRPDGHGGWVWNLDGIEPVLYRLPELIEAVSGNHPIFVVEGEKDVETLLWHGIPATTCAGGANKWRPQYDEAFRDADVIVMGDNDKGGREHMESVAASLSPVAKRVRVLDLAQHWPACPAKGDVSDWFQAGGGTVDRLWEMVDKTAEWTSMDAVGADCAGTGRANSDVKEWPDPQPLPVGLPPVDTFASEFMPKALAPWVDDIANRLQCPPDYVGISAITAFGAVLGRRIGIKPQQKNGLVRSPEYLGGLRRPTGDAEVACDGRGAEADSPPGGRGREGQ